MKWAVQTTIIDVDASNKVADAALDCGCEITPIFLEPFAYKLPEMNVIEGEFVIFYGSAKLVSLVADSSFRGGVFYSDEAFSYQYHISLNGDMMLNSDAEVSTLGDYIWKSNDPFFVRPLGDLKQFTGMLVSNSDEMQKWQARLAMAGLDDFLDTEILVATPKLIDSEYRCFVVDGKVIDVTRYVAQRQTKYCRVDDTHLPEDISAYLTDALFPANICVADVALMNDGSFNIIEFNCFNASGFYLHDIGKIVRSVTEWCS